MLVRRSSLFPLLLSPTTGVTTLMTCLWLWCMSKNVLGLGVGLGLGMKTVRENLVPSRSKYHFFRPFSFTSGIFWFPNENR
jgi:hypothetical protein